MNSISMLKGAGYLVSAVSVMLLAAVSWQATATDSMLRLCLVVGALSSIAGMALRWMSHRVQQNADGAEG